MVDVNIKGKNLISLFLFIFALTLLVYRLYRLDFKLIETVQDFKQYYDAGTEINKGHNPYFRSAQFNLVKNTPHTYYPPTAFLLFSPLSRLPFFESLVFWQALSLIFLFGSLKLLAAYFWGKVNFWSFSWLLSLILLSFPVNDTIWLGSVNFWELFTLSISIVLLMKKKNFSSGIFLSLAAITRPFYLSLGLFFALRKNWRALLGLFLGVGLLNFLVVLIWGISPHMVYFNEVLPWVKENIDIGNAYNQALNGFLGRLNLPNAQFNLVNLFSSLCFLTVLVLWTLKKKLSSIDLGIRMSNYLPLLFILKGYSWRHHGVVLIIPIIIIFSAFKNRRFSELVFLFLGLTLLFFGFKHPPSMFLELSKEFGLLVGNIVVSHFFIGVIFLWLFIILKF